MHDSFTTALEQWPRDGVPGNPRAWLVSTGRFKGFAVGLIDGILARGDLAEYHLAHAARADLLRRSGRKAEARAAYERALALARQEVERRFLAGRMKAL